MRTGIVIDSACDFAVSFLDAHHVHLLPILLCRGETRLPDQRDPEATLAFYRQYQADKTLDADTAPPTVADIQARLLDELALHYDRVLDHHHYADPQPVVRPRDRSCLCRPQAIA